MPPIDMEDATGTPRPERDVLAAIEFATREMMAHPTAMTKEGFPMVMHYIIIREALRELLVLRRAVESLRKQEEP
jgi:hypothetical protein